MATVKISGTIKYKDMNGNTTILYPTTTKDSITGMEEIDAHVNSSKPIEMNSTDGVTYTCTVPGIDSLIVGTSFIGVPNIESTSQAVKLTVNSLEEKLLRRRVSTRSATTTAGYDTNWLSAGKPLRIMYDGFCWVVDIVRPYAADLMGVVPIANGGTGNGTGYITTGKKDGTTLGTNATAEGTYTTASGDCSHAEGEGTTASGRSSHAEGNRTVASGKFSHAEGGYNTKATGEASHAEGASEARGEYSHAEGDGTYAVGDYSHAEGGGTYALGDYSHAEGGYTRASGYFQHVSGKFNTKYDGPTSTDDTTGSIFIVGNGTGDTTRSNAFRITTAGACMGTQSFTASGADYAEYFEWSDGNPDGEDRRGLFVTLVGDKIRIANDNDDYILGVVSARPSVIGDGFTDKWKHMYLTDVFGEEITETIEVPESVDEETGRITPAHTETRFVLNPKYNHEHKYIGRELRKEWTPVGLVGKLVIVDDGTCEVDGYCKVAASGGATKSTEKTPYRVMTRLDDTHIKVCIK